MKFPLYAILAASLCAYGADFLPTDSAGRPLNLGFETGDLRDWKAEGSAFQGQPVRGDTVAARRADSRSQHDGESWIGGFERIGDEGKGTLTSVPFKVTQPWGSFLFNGGHWDETRVELVDAATKQVFFKISGLDSEGLRPVVIELKGLVGKEIFIRLVDDHTGGWGHLNFDNFRFHSERPTFANELTLAETQKNAPPPADDVLFAGLTATEAAAKATLPPGFKMHVFASEPDVRNPIAFCDDDRGRIWVVEGLTYPRRVGHPPAKGSESEVLKDIFSGKDRILVFEDTDGDHKADKRTVFMEGLNLVSGIEFGFGGLWVGAAPYLMFIPITDGDQPKPAGDPRILLDGWNYSADTHETLNTFTWGPDGWLYGCHGVFCPSHVGKPGAAEADRQWVDAGAWRYHPVKHRFEIFTEGGSNPWGIDFDERGNLWAEMCVIPHLFHMIQGARITRQGGEHYAFNAAEAARNSKNREARSRKPIYPYVYEDIGTHADHVHWAGAGGPHAANGRSDAMGGGHAHAGMLCYLGTSWPAEYRGNLIIGNIHGQRLNTDIPVAKGSGYVGKHGKDLLNFNDKWSQTLNQRIDADGNLIVIDWYDANQCHHNRDDGHDHASGRIYKVAYGDARASTVNLAKLGDAELAAKALSRNEWESRKARRILMERGAGGTEAAENLKTARTTEARLRALWSLSNAGGLTESAALKLLEDRDEWIRGWTIQLAFDSTHTPPGAGFVAAVSKLAATDSSPVVRRFIASALQQIAPAERWDALSALLAHGEDVSDHNLPLLYWYAAEGAVATNPDKAAVLLKDCRIPKIREFIARRLTQMALAQN